MDTNEELYETGWDLWYDEGIKITERYLPVIAHHVKHCSVFALMMTNRCLNRPFVMNYELEYARQRGIPIIPVLLEELEPQPWSKENVDQLLKTAIAPDTLLNRISTAGLPNQGKRIAVPPAMKQNVVYDVVLPPELPGFKFTIQGDEITITRYIGNDTEVVIPGTITLPDGSMTFRVTAIGDYTFSGGGFLSNLGMSESIKNTDKKVFKACKLLKSVVIPNTVTNIGKFAFSECKSLASVIIPDSVTSIGDSAFQGCKSLETVIVPDSVTNIGGSAFGGCKSLKNITIPDSITGIGSYTFWKCKSLANITIPNSVTSIGSGAFQNCKSLINITIPDSVTSIGSGAFQDCKSLINITIPYSVTKIEEDAFSRCESLKSVIFPDDIEEIGKSAFSYCPKLDAIFNADKTTIFHGPENWKAKTPYYIPDGVTKINSGAFLSPGRLSFFMKLLMRLIFPSVVRCRPPEIIVIPKSVTEINDEAFKDDGNLKNIIIPDSVTSIGNDAFKNCKSLKSINIPDSVTSIGENAFFGCKSLTNIVIPENVSWMGESVFSECVKLKSANIIGSDDTIVDLFSGCTSLINVTLSDEITCIGYGTFKKCKAIKSFTIPDSITSIGEVAFESCISLKTVIIPDSVTSIGERAFGDCKSLKNITIPESVKNIGANAFENTPLELTISERISTYESENTEPDINNTIQEPAAKKNQVKIEQFKIPICEETPRAKVCCATFDVHNVSALLTELYWEGFNIFFNKSSNQQEIEESQCILAFISNKTNESEQAMNILKKAVQYDVSRIIQVFIGDCVELPAEIRSNLHDRQAIIRKNLSEQEFTGKIRDSLRQFGCSLGHPRGFEVNNMGDAVEIVKFIPTDFNQVVIPKTFFNPPLPVTSIGADAFRDCESITSVVIPDGVTIIKGYISNGAFSGCKSLNRVVLPKSLEKIGQNTFISCDSLAAITIPDSVTDIGDNAFSYCESLTTVVIPKNLKTIANMTFSGCVALRLIIIPDSVTHIEDNAFFYSKSLKNIVIPESVISIGEGAFSLCESLLEVTIPGNVKSIGHGAFSNCESLTNVNIISADTGFEPKRIIEKYIPKPIKVFLKFISFFMKNSIEKNNSKSGAFTQCKKLTIHTIPNGKAWQYAKKNKIKCEPLDGDAVKQNYAKSLYNLGINYANGDGVPKDLNMARYWLTLAVGKGNEKAKEELAKLGTE